MHRHPNGFVDIPAELFACPHETSEVLNVKRSYMYADLCGGQSHKECETRRGLQVQLATAPEHSTVPLAVGSAEPGRKPKVMKPDAAPQRVVPAWSLEHAAVSNKERHDCTYTAFLKSSQNHSSTNEGYSLPKSTVKLILTGRS